MEIGETIYVTTREEFREWLEKNHKTCKEIWLIQYKKFTQKPSIPYVDAVEEAICFGWIDGFEKGMDDQRYAKRFTPRRQKSLWTETNIERARKMIEEGKLLLPSMKARGGGSIINISSIGGLSPEPMLGIYSVSKSALVMLTKVLG